MMIFFVCLIRISSLITNSGNKFANKQIVIFDMITYFYSYCIYVFDTKNTNLNRRKNVACVIQSHYSKYLVI